MCCANPLSGGVIANLNNQGPKSVILSLLEHCNLAPEEKYAAILAIGLDYTHMFTSSLKNHINKAPSEDRTKNKEICRMTILTTRLG